MLKKKYGQHFLTDANILRRIVDFSGIRNEDTVVEIGSGAGALTRELASVAKRVIAIEIDRDLIAPLRQWGLPKVEIIEGNALEIDLANLTPDKFHLVGNLPYNVATPLLKRFIQFRS